jgi:hypothetical protein
MSFSSARSTAYSTPNTNYFAILADLPDMVSTTVSTTPTAIPSTTPTPYENEFFPKVIFNEGVRVNNFDLYYLLKHLNIGDSFYANELDIHLDVKVVDTLGDEFMRFTYTIFTEYGGFCEGGWVFEHEHSTTASSAIAIDRYDDCWLWYPARIQRYFKIISNDIWYFCEKSPMIKPCADR